VIGIAGAAQRTQWGDLCPGRYRRVWPAWSFEIRQSGVVVGGSDGAPSIGNLAERPVSPARPPGGGKSSPLSCSSVAPKSTCRRELPDSGAEPTD